PVVSGSGAAAERKARAAELRQQADAVRREVLAERLDRAFTSDEQGSESKPGSWDIATYAEAHYGLGQFEHAEQWLRKLPNDLAEWERQTCFSQLVRLAQLRGQPLGATDQALQPLLPLLGSNAKAEHVAELAARARRGKVGLALSG